MSDYCGVINVYKEKGYTSHDVVAVVRGALSRGAQSRVKAGHTGTLDPEAEGVLPVCVGRATKIAELLAAREKGYRAVVNLGATTDTLDFTGTVQSQNGVTAGEEDIRRVVESFKGEQMQTPPMYSAVKVGGRRLYDIARSGAQVERRPRAVTIYDISVAEFLDDTRFVIDVECSKGTYIRVICSEIGEKLGCGAHMGALVRTRSGRFTVGTGYKLAQIREAAENGRVSELILPVEDVLTGYSRITVCGAGEKPLYNGNRIKAGLAVGGLNGLAVGSRAMVYDGCGMLVGLYSIDTKDGEAVLKPEVMLYDAHSRR